MKSTHKNIHTLLRDHGLSIKKKFGQNFLVDENILDKIVFESGASKDTLVIEIGPGLGSLTRRLLEKAGALIAYEIDRDLIPVLNTLFQDEPNFHLIEGDVLKRNVDEDIASFASAYKEVIVVANLPYYITTPILMKLLEESQIITRYTVMMQLEVARRLTAQTNTKDYNALSVALKYRTRPRFAFKVPKNVFIPVPNVESAVITLDVHQTSPYQVTNEAFFFDFIKQAFKQRRKTMLNNLTAAYPLDKDTVITMLEAHDINPQARAESLPIEVFVTLANIFYKAL